MIREWWDRLVGWLEALRLGNPAAFRLFVFALLVALVLVLAHGAWVVWRTVRGASAPDDGTPGGAPRERRDAAWYLREADRAAAAGRTAEALQLAFVGLALTLDGQGLLRYHASQTPAEVARAARLAAEDRERLRALVRASTRTSSADGRARPTTTAAGASAAPVRGMQPRTELAVGTALVLVLAHRCGGGGSQPASG